MFVVIFKAFTGMLSRGGHLTIITNKTCTIQIWLKEELLDQKVTGLNPLSVSLSQVITHFTVGKHAVS